MELAKFIVLTHLSFRILVATHFVHVQNKVLWDHRIWGFGRRNERSEVEPTYQRSFRSSVLDWRKRSPSEAERVKRMVTALSRPIKWNQKYLTYRVSAYTTQNISRHFIDTQLARAFNLWQQHADLEFRKSSDFDVDIEIEFVNGDHGDSSPFLDHTLAHAFLPTAGEALGGNIHFNDGYLHWEEGTTFLHTAVHEIGHALGMTHSALPQAVMSPYQGNFKMGVALDAEDVERIQALYGPRIARPLKETGVHSSSSSAKAKASTKSPMREIELEDDLERISVNRSDDERIDEVNKEKNVSVRDEEVDGLSSESWRDEEESDTELGVTELIGGRNGSSELEQDLNELSAETTSTSLGTQYIDNASEELFLEQQNLNTSTLSSNSASNLSQLYKYIFIPFLVFCKLNL